MDLLSEKTQQLSLGPDTDPSSTAQTADYYIYRKSTAKITFARLEKGLLLFIYVYETSKTSLGSELSLWEHRACIHVIKDGSCPKPPENCRRDHQTNYRQEHLCAFWYTNDGCSYGKRCKNAHQLDHIHKYHRWIRTQTDVDVFRLIRFVRNFAGHFIDSVVSEQQELYKDLILTMVHLVHYLSPKEAKSIDHLYLFLEKTTIDQLIPMEDLLAKLTQPFDIPEVFFQLHVDFNTAWYHSDGRKRSIDFKGLSSEFVNYFNQVFAQYYEGRLRSRGAKKAWS